MNTLFCDECFQNLYYAQETMKNWIQLSDYEIIFEAVNPDVQDKLLKNEKTGEESVGFIQKAINGVIKIITNIIETIKDFLDKLTMSGAEREAYERFKQEIAKDPKLRNRKVTVADFRSITSNYDKMIAEVDREIKAVETDPNRPIDATVEKVKGFLSNTVGAAVGIPSSMVAVSAATKIADSNIEMAREIQSFLNKEQGIMKMLSQHLGKREAKKFKKNIDAAAKNTKLHRLKVSLFKKKYDSLQDCISSTLESFQKLSPETFALGKKLLGNEYTGTVIKGAIKNVARTKLIDEPKAKREEKREERRAAKEAKKQAKFNEKHADDPKYKSKTDFMFGN
jgi:hypothetical protein